MISIVITIIFWFVFILLYIGLLLQAIRQNIDYNKKQNIDQEEAKDLIVWTCLLPINFRDENYNIKYSLMKISTFFLILGNGQFIEVLQFYITQQQFQSIYQILIIFIQIAVNYIMQYFYLMGILLTNLFEEKLCLKRKKVNQELIQLLQKDSRHWAMYVLFLNLSFTCSTTYGYHILEYEQTVYHLLFGLIISLFTLILECVVYRCGCLSIYRIYLRQNVDKKNIRKQETQIEMEQI